MKDLATHISGRCVGVNQLE